MLNATERPALRNELLQVMAVCAKWIADLDLRDVEDVSRMHALESDVTVLQAEQDVSRELAEPGDSVHARCLNNEPWEVG